MKNITLKITYSFIIILLFSGCSILNEIVPVSKKVSGEWTVEEWGGGGSNALSPKNHNYTFDIKGQKQTISLTFNSDVDLKPYLYDPLGQLISDIYLRINKGTNTLELTNLNSGKYLLVICTQERNDFGKYSIDFTGIDGTPQKTSFEKLNVNNISFGDEGGAGRVYSFKNHVYTFDVTSDKSSIDCELQSADTDLYFEVYNTLGEFLFRDIYYTGRKIFTIKETNKGKYTVLVASAQRDSKGKYNLKIFGNISNLKQVETQSKIVNDTWLRGTSHTYTVNITEDNTPLDITLQSPDNNCTFELQNPIGDVIKSYNIYNGRYDSNIEKINKGLYRIVTKPLGNANTQPANMKYTLSVYGKFTDLKKL